MKTTKEILIEAKNKISDPKKWTKRAYARDVDGSHVGAGEPEAVCWCSVGAIDAVLWQQDDESGAFNKAFAVLLAQTSENCIIKMNDQSSHADVMAAFDAAIEAAQ